MSRIRFAAVLALAVSASGCAGFEALDQAAADMARQAPTCTQEPAIGADNYGGKTCRVSHTVWSSTTTVEEPGKAPVTTRTVTTPSGTTTEIAPTP